MANIKQNKYDEDFKKSLVSLYQNGRTYHTFSELQLSVFEYIEGYYNSQRPHSSLGYLTPNEAESAYWGQN